MGMAESAMGVVNDWRSAAVSYFTPAARERLWRRSFAAGAPTSPWSNALPLASGWIDFQTDSIALNITTSIPIAQVVLVQLPPAGTATNVTCAPAGYSPSLAAPGILVAWLRGDLLYLALIGPDGGLAQSILLPMN
jgi:hypothetical protein